MTRLKGQETELLIVVNGAPQNTITTVRSLEINTETEILSEGYLGETSERKDSIFKGMSGKIELHIENQDILKLFQKITDKARRRTPGVKINLKTTLNFSNGQRPRVLISDVEFGPMPLSFSSRADYANVSLDWAASDPPSFLF
jgi:hypothetical protein